MVMKNILTIILLCKSSYLFCQSYQGYYTNLDTTDYAPRDTICVGVCLTFYSYISWIPSYIHWNFEGGTPDQYDGDSATICYYTPGDFPVEVFWGAEDSLDDPAYSYHPHTVIVNYCQPSSSFNYPDLICAGDCINFSNTSENYPLAYFWTFEGANILSSTLQNPTEVCFASAGIYKVSLVSTNPAGSDTLIQYITVNPSPEGETVNENYTIAYGENIVLDACATGDNYFWQPAEYLNCHDCSNPTASPMLPEINYTATVSNTNGCSINCYYNIQVTDIPSDIFVPNTFTPNGDGLNDVFLIPEDYIQLLSFQIFDRWGEKLFETTDIHTGWDGTVRGKHALPGVYAYFISYKIYNGGKEYMKTGNITLIR